MWTKEKAGEAEERSSLSFNQKTHPSIEMLQSIQQMTSKQGVYVYPTLDGFNMNVFGSGEDAHEVQSADRRLDLNLNFQKGKDHADDSLHRYEVFINPSISDVLCTTTVEGLAMGKFVVYVDHPSNEFFSSFPNCLIYQTPEDFVEKVKEALENEPYPLTPEQRYKLSWEAATQRFMEYSDLDQIHSIIRRTLKS
ncbi:Digalactosyldiacylglycerol synthase 1 [Lathyrus oleraceus]|uniref:Digalactosyldiacylglycerol synthase 1 n=1 Tax=Pisum sativum TaxID=3888 RepID=A0A9D4VVL8_PEA|nr:Digalactosyldiacylglycerol synthase 1 [Pisum sativum]